MEDSIDIDHGSQDERVSTRHFGMLESNSMTSSFSCWPAQANRFFDKISPLHSRDSTKGRGVWHVGRETEREKL